MLSCTHDSVAQSLEVAQSRCNTQYPACEEPLLSALFNFARAEGMTGAPNPCAGVKGTKRSATFTFTTPHSPQFGKRLT
jgi:hypothetical protein